MHSSAAETAASFARIISALEQSGSRSAFTGQHKAKFSCPAHEDEKPTLAIDYNEADRTTLVYCNAGCDTKDVVAAVGLRLSDLFDDPMPEGKATRRTSRTSLPSARRADSSTKVRKKDAPRRSVKKGKQATPPAVATALAPGEPIPGDTGQPNRRDEYALRHGELVKVIRKTTTGEVIFDTVLGCAARIVRVETEDYGAEQADNPGQPQTIQAGQDEEIIEQQPTTGYVLELVHPKRTDEPVLMRVSLKKFADGSWLSDLPWPNIYHRSTRAAVAQIAAAIRSVSEDTARVPVYRATGWRRRGEGWMWVHAGGGITADGHVPLRTEFAGRLGLLALPAPTDDRVRLRQPMEDALSIMDRTPAHVAVPLLGLAFRAPYTHCPSSISLYGLPGAYKTALGTVTMRFFAPTLSRNQPLMSLSANGSTLNAGPEVLWRMKDVLMLADDSAPDRGVQDAARRTSTASRSQYNSEAKLRLRYRDGRPDLDEARGPRGSLVQTGEVLASADSAQQRMLTLEMRQGETDLAELQDMDRPEFGRSCALLMASYIQWIARDYTTHLATVSALEIHLANALHEYAGNRPAEHLGRFATGWHMMLQFLCETGVTTPDETAWWWEKVWTALMDAADHERNLLEAQAMHRRVLDYLATALKSKQCHLVDRKGLCPADPADPRDRTPAQRYGWYVVDTVKDSEEKKGSRPVLKPGGVQLGAVAHVVDEETGLLEERLWIDHKQATRIALRVAAELGQDLNARDHDLTEALRQAQVIAVEWESARGGRWVKPRRPMPGGRTRVWDMPASALGLNMAETADTDTSAPRKPRPAAPPAPTALFDLSLLTGSGAPADLTAPVQQQALPERKPEPEPDPSPEAEPQAKAEPEAHAVPQPAPSAAAPAEPEPKAPIAEAPSTAPTRAPWPAPLSETEPWRAAGAVIDVDGVYLPDGTVLDLPVPPEEINAGTLARMAWDLGLGHGGSKRGSGPSKKWRPDVGLIFIHDALAAALNLPDPDATADDEDDEDYGIDGGLQDLRRHNNHPFLQRARDKGWTVEKWGLPTRIYRELPDGTTIGAAIEVTPWARTTAWGRHKGVEFLKDHPSPTVLAARIQRVCDLGGISFRHSAGATAHDLLRAMRPERGGRAAPLARTEMPEFLHKRMKLYSGRSWVRGLTSGPGCPAITEAEKGKKFILAFDQRASYLSVSGAARFGRGELTHLTGPDLEFDPTLPGYWMAKLPSWHVAGCFDLFGPRCEGEPRPYATPTLAAAQEDFDIDVEVTEAWVWRTHDRTLEPWYQHLRDSIKSLSDEPDIVRATIKGYYAEGIGKFAAPSLAGNPRKGIEPNILWRPDISDIVLATQQRHLVRRIIAIGEETGMWPLAVMTDCLWYATDDPTFATAVPGLPQGGNLGHFKPHSAARMSDVLAHLESDRRAQLIHSELYTKAAEWEAGA